MFEYFLDHLGISDCGDDCHFPAASNGYEAVRQGTGLGLSVALGIAKQHGGDLFLDEIQKKTTFTLKIPRVQPAESTAVGKVS